MWLCGISISDKEIKARWIFMEPITEEMITDALTSLPGLTRTDIDEDGWMVEKGNGIIRLNNREKPDLNQIKVAISFLEGVKTTKGMNPRARLYDLTKIGKRVMATEISNGAMLVTLQIIGIDFMPKRTRICEVPDVMTNISSKWVSSMRDIARKKEGHW